MAVRQAYRHTDELVSIPEYTPGTAARRKKKSITKRKSRAKLILYILMSFAIGSLLVGRYVVVEETGRELRNARIELNMIESRNQQLQLQINRAIDLVEVERIAIEEFGMRRVERHQMFFIDMNTANFGERISQNEEPADRRILSGVPGILINAIETLR